MRRKSFYLEKRGRYWFSRIIDPQTGKVLTAKNTGQTDRDMAAAVAAGWMMTGTIPAGRKRKPKTVESVMSVSRLIDKIKSMDLTNQDAYRIMGVLKDRGLLDKVKEAEERDFISFLLEFYDYDNSPYVREKLAHGQSIGRTHCKDSIFRINGYWKKWFEGRTLSSITREDLRDFSLSLVDQKYAASTINKTMIAGKVALAWAFREGYIPTNPGEKLATFVGKSEERGILTDEEADNIFALEWEDERAYVGNLVADTCGLRSGEVLGLRQEDIGLDRLFIRHSYSPLDGLKTPKNGDSRQVPLLPHVRQALLDLAEKNPWNDGFIFYSAKQGQPMDHKFLSEGLYEALEKIGITKEERKERNIVFHSWRHRFATKMADIVDERSLGLVTGHKSQAMLEHYAAHVNENHFKAVQMATEKAFGTV